MKPAIHARVAWALTAALAAVAPVGARAQPLIGPGQEQRVLALFAPYELGGEVRDGFALWNVAIEHDCITVTLRARNGRETTLTLRHPDDAPDGASRTASFAAIEDGSTDADARAARRALLEAVRRNDDGSFWPRARETVTVSGNQLFPAIGRWSFHWAATGWVPIDGIGVILLVYLLGLLLAVRVLWREPRWMGVALAGIVAAGAVVRALLAPATFLGAWPWSRLYPHVRAVADGRWLAAVAEHTGATFYLTDVAMWTNFAYAAAMPLVLFSHATYLLRDARTGLAAAFALAFLPQHVRFSLCEDGFVASLVLTSLAFALIHGWMRDPSPAVRWLLLAALPFVLYPGYLLRPLNLAFVVVYGAAILALHRESAPPWRRAVALGVVVLVAAAASVVFFSTNVEAVGAAASSLGWLSGTLDVLLDPKLLVLTDPTRTPLALILLAGMGGAIGWRRGERALVVFLAGWLLLFVALHAFVVQEAMQPRYHLHLVVPFLLLGAIAVPHLFARWGRWMWGVSGVVALSPWVHEPFVRDVGYAEMHEYAFVRSARDRVPEGCTVLEFTGSPYAIDELRFSRIGALAAGDRLQRFRPVAVFADGRTRPSEVSLESLFHDPPSCLYFYEGLACTTFAGRGESYAGTCTELRRRLRAQTVLEARAPPRFYDSNNQPRHGPAPPYVPFRLSRARLE